MSRRCRVPRTSGQSWADSSCQPEKAKEKFGRSSSSPLVGAVAPHPNHLIECFIASVSSLSSSSPAHPWVWQVEVARALSHSPSLWYYHRHPRSSHSSLSRPDIAASFPCSVRDLASRKVVLFSALKPRVPAQFSTANPQRFIRRSSRAPSSSLRASTRTHRSGSHLRHL